MRGISDPRARGLCQRAFPAPSGNRYILPQPSSRNQIAVSEFFGAAVDFAYRGVCYLTPARFFFFLVDASLTLRCLTIPAGLLTLNQHGVLHIEATGQIMPMAWAYVQALTRHGQLKRT